MWSSLQTAQSEASLRKSCGWVRLEMLPFAAAAAALTIRGYCSPVLTMTMVLVVSCVFFFCTISCSAAAVWTGGRSGFLIWGLIFV